MSQRETNVIASGWGWRAKDGLHRRLKSQCTLFLCILLLQNISAHGQLYTYPDRVNSQLEAALLREVSGQPADEKKLQDLIRLASIYYYKPLHRVSALQKSLIYARQAKALATQLNNRDDFEKAVLLVADALIQSGEIPEAELELPALSGKTRIELLLTLSFQLLLANEGSAAVNIETSGRYLSEADSLSKAYGDCTSKAQIGTIRGVWLSSQSQYRPAEQILLSTLHTVDSSHCLEPQYLDLELGQFYTNSGDYEKSLKYCLKGLKEAEARSDSLSLGDLNDLIAIVFRNTGKLPAARDHFTMAMQYYLRWPGTRSNLELEIKYIGQVFIGEKEYQKALAFFLQAYSQYPPETYRAKKIAAGTIGDCYLKLKQFDKAEHYFQYEFRLAESAEAINEETYHRLAFFYVESGSFRKALPYLRQALMRISQANLQTKRHLYYMFYLTYYALGDYKSAVYYLKENNKCDDTLFEHSKYQALLDLQAKYEDDKKTGKINLLTKTSQLDQANLRHAEFLRNISICGSIAFAILGAVFYKQYRRKKEMSAQLEVLLQDKEWLLREVHHRVKNNLHTVICLLQIQAEFLKDDALRAIESSQHRIYAMSLIHQKLYLTDETETINLQMYLEELISYLKESFTNDQRISYDVEVKPLKVDIAIAIPIGLIVNEAITNSIKHAFVGRRQNNMIRISLDEVGKGVSLTIADNGIGINLNDDPLKWGSLGLKMIRGLSQDLEASLDISNVNGTRITIQFTTDLNANHNKHNRENQDTDRRRSIYRGV
ncbi:MAG TPA: histidine kinase dimerization/phosphoacceptor domain -containing protein [Puia sp.]|nr:histidine kinase dimerization/phosphoacceptor domain -containing protein [Puia sp.]